MFRNLDMEALGQSVEGGRGRRKGGRRGGGREGGRERKRKRR
jgi:hypothetical protein